MNAALIKGLFSAALHAYGHEDIFLSATSVANRKRLQVLQNRGLRCALNKGPDISTDELHDEAGLFKLKRKQHLLHFMHGWAQDKKRL